MTPPMTLPEWMQWRYRQNVNMIREAIPDVQIDLPVYNPDMTKPLPLCLRIKYWMYLLCATSTRVMAWLLFVCVLISVMIIAVIVTVFRMQWKAAIDVPGPVLFWNHTDVLTHVPPVGPHVARLRRAVHLADRAVNINVTHIPQGVFLEPFPKPIIDKERVLGISQIVMIDSGSIAQSMNLDLYMKHLLVDMINEEMVALSNVVLPFELPVGDPSTQDQYIHKRCYQRFAHCYIVWQPGRRVWPTSEIIQDQCPLPDHPYRPLGYMQQNAYDLYLQPPRYGLQNVNLTSLYGTARIGAYRVLYPEQYNATIFCSDQLYGNWWYLNRTSEQKEETYRKKMLNLTENNSSILKDRALPPTWTPKGQARLFRELNPLDFCTKPEAVMLLNQSYYTWSLWEGDCYVYNRNISFPPECVNYTRIANKTAHPYACRHWRLLSTGNEGKDEIKCSEYGCLFYPKYDQFELANDFGFLAYQKMFPSPICIQNYSLSTEPYKVQSLYQECIQKGTSYDLEDVINQLLRVLQNNGIDLGKVPASRAFTPFYNQMPVSYKKRDVTKRKSCGRRKRGDNFRKLQTSGLSMNQAISTLAKISDLNDENLAAGIHLLQEHIVTLMEATVHDISMLEAAHGLQILHTHLSTLRLLLTENRVDWNLIDSTWIQQQLQADEALMSVIRRTARSMTYRVIQQINRPDMTLWELGIYYELIIPKKVWLTNWKIQNIGHLIKNAGHLARVELQHPYEIVNQDCEQLTYLELKGCQELDYLVCEEILQHEPCGNQTGSDCPVTAQKIRDPYVWIYPLKNGSYLIMSSHTDCAIPPYEPVLVTVNDTVTCFGTTLKKPLRTSLETFTFQPHIPQLQVRLPHLVGLIAKIKGLKIEITSTWENIKDQIKRSEAELLRLDLHEGDYAEWTKQLGKALEDIWPAAAQTVSKIGDFLGKIADGIFGTTFSLLTYAKPVIIGIVVIVLLILIIRILSWLAALGPRRRRREDKGE
nr:envelope glycoprotein [Equine foamy virus]